MSLKTLECKIMGSQKKEKEHKKFEWQLFAMKLGDNCVYGTTPPPPRLLDGLQGPAMIF